jgi:hypothetical protein
MDWKQFDQCLSNLPTLLGKPLRCSETGPLNRGRITAKYALIRPMTRPEIKLPDVGALKAKVLAMAEEAARVDALEKRVDVSWL